MSANKGARLWLRRRRGNRKALWFIRDGGHIQSTGCGAADRRGAEQALAGYLARKHVETQPRGRHPDQIEVADVIALYLRDVAPRRSRPREFAARAKALLAWWNGKTLADVTGATCREYAHTHPRRHLEDLRAAIRHHHREGLCEVETKVALPDDYAPRDRWLTRVEAAALLWSAWRQGGYQRKHIARFILIAIYTGSRAGAICGAATSPQEGRGWIDYDRGVFYRRAIGARETNKRAPPIPLPDRLMAHLRRWRRKNLSRRFVLEYKGRPVYRMKRGFSHAVRDAGLDEAVTPHTLRHTAATWLMQAGAETWAAAGYLGMSMEMLVRRYGHHHPDHLRSATRAIVRGPQVGHRSSGTEQEDATRNVVKMHGKSRTG